MSPVPHKSASRPIRKLCEVPEKAAPEGYESLARVLEAALEQSSGGKGATRHADGNGFLEQPIMVLGRFTGPEGTAFQVMKKTRESLGMVRRNQHAAAKAELLGAIVYAAATYLLVEEQEP